MVAPSALRRLKTPSKMRPMGTEISAKGAASLDAGRVTGCVVARRAPVVVSLIATSPVKVSASGAPVVLRIRRRSEPRE